jgi:hypothetical protein
MHMQKTRVIQPHRPCMRMDERGHRLQRNEVPEHQEAERCMRHCQAIQTMQRGPAIVAGDGRILPIDP